MKTCIVLNCCNTDDPEIGGDFIGDICAPCHEFITEGRGKHSQAYRNALGISAREIKRRVISSLEMIQAEMELGR